jgi:very-short-patch-repair endonuclease
MRDPNSQPRVSCSERCLAKHLRKKGVRFQQQAPIDRYHVDFLVSPNIIIEAEGKVHSNTLERDSLRTEHLENRGYRVFRVPNYMIFADPDGVAEMIKQQYADQRDESKNSPTAQKNGRGD